MAFIFSLFLFFPSSSSFSFPLFSFPFLFPFPLSFLLFHFFFSFSFFSSFPFLFPLSFPFLFFLFLLFSNQHHFLNLVYHFLRAPLPCSRTFCSPDFGTLLSKNLQVYMIFWGLHGLGRFLFVFGELKMHNSRPFLVLIYKYVWFFGDARPLA